LGSGSVIHAMSDEQDIRKMGGLKKFIPITHITFLIGTLAISGFPFLSGFFSKDEILAHALAHNPLIYGLLAFSALLTAIYMFRMYFVVFYGEFRGSEHAKSHLHESPLNMTLPLVVLAVLSFFGGWLNVPSLLGGHHWFSHLLEHNVGGLNKIAEVEISNGQTMMLMISASVLTLIALFVSYSVYVKKKSIPVEDSQLSGWAKVSANKLYIDEIYNALFVKPIEWISEKGHQVIELFLLNGIVTFATKTIDRSGELVKKWQSGKTDWYILWMVFGIIGLVIYYLVKI
jgi:NADH-quinone oxidoreductase subunit L